MSNFDPDAFLSQSLDGVLDTKQIPCPPGEYPAVITGVKPRLQRSTDGTEYLIFDVLWRIDDPEVSKKVSRDQVIVRQSLFIDRTPSGGIDTSKGRNTQLGRLREAVGQNRPGPWAPSMLVGQAARVFVVEDVDKSTGDRYDRVKSVARL